MMTFNGGNSDANTFPDDSMLTESAEVAPGHVIRRGKLTPAIDGSYASLSPILAAPSSELTERILGKINVLRGLDMPYRKNDEVRSCRGDRL
jgi:hypothetical protein